MYWAEQNRDLWPSKVKPLLPAQSSFSGVLVEGRLEGSEQNKLQTKLEIVPLLLELKLNVQKVTQCLELDVEIVRQAAENQC